MKRALLIFCVFNILMLVCFLEADSYKEIFNQGVQNYKEKKYNDAIDNFEKILEHGRSNKEIYYNLGNCYFRINNIGKAILFYEKAKTFDAHDTDLIYNLEIAKSRIQNPIIVPPKLFFIRWWNNIMNNLSFQYSGYAVLIIMFAILISSFFLAYYSDRKFTYIFIFIRKIFIITFVVFVFIILLKYNYIKNNKNAIVLDKKTPLKSEPFPESKELIFIPEGTKVRVIKKTDKWLEIELPDGNRGWAMLKQIRTI